MEKNKIDLAYETFVKELKENDKKVQKEINTKSREDMSKEFMNFAKTNKCKVKGGKNGKKYS